MTSTLLSQRPLDRRGALTLIAAGTALIAVCYGFARFAYGLFLPPIRTEFGLEASTAGAIASGSYVAYCAAIIVSTALTPRFGSRVLAVSAGVIAASGTALVALAPNPALLAVGVVVAGSSTGVASPPLAHAVAHSLRAAVQGRAQTVINAGTGLGVAVAGPAALLASGHWRLGWFAFSAISAAVTVWVLRAVPSAGRPGPARTTNRGASTSAERCAETPSHAKDGRGAVSALLHRPVFPPGSGRIIAASGLMGIASSAVWTFGRDVLGSVGGMGPTASAIAWILLGAFGILGALAGDAARRIGLRRSWVLGMLLLAAATVLFAPAAGIPGAAGLLCATFGAVYIALTGLLLVWGTEVYASSPATGVGLAFLVVAVGQAVGAPLTGELIGDFGPHIAFAVIGGCAAVGVLVGPRRRQ